MPEPPAQEDRYDDGTGAALWKAVQTLPAKARAVVVLRYYEQLSEAEVADLLPAIEANRRSLALLDRFDVSEVRSALAFNPEVPD